MDTKSWSVLTTAEFEPAETLWGRVLDFVPEGTLLKFECTDAVKKLWIYQEAGTLTCGPDGDMRTPVAANEALPMPSAPIGCLLAKLGGSTAAVGTAAATSPSMVPGSMASGGAPGDGTIFAVGSFCVHKVDKDGGPLYLGMNVSPSKLPRTKPGVIAVTISESRP